jgi:hypothetical protein
MSNKIPTAEEFIDLWKNGDDWIDPTQLPNLLIEFAKLHCKAQLEAIIKNAAVKTKVYNYGEFDVYHVVDIKSIINGYDLNQIK